MNYTKAREWTSFPALPNFRMQKLFSDLHRNKDQILSRFFRENKSEGSGRAPCSLLISVCYGWRTHNLRSLDCLIHGFTFTWKSCIKRNVLRTLHYNKSVFWLLLSLLFFFSWNVLVLEKSLIFDKISWYFPMKHWFVKKFMTSLSSISIVLMV